MAYNERWTFCPYGREIDSYFYFLTLLKGDVLVDIAELYGWGLLAAAVIWPASVIFFDKKTYRKVEKND